MSKIAVIYWSGTGRTEAMARAVADACGGECIACGAFDASSVSSYDALALGCPAMGAEQLEDSEFEPLYTAIKPALAGKKLGLFGSYGWGDGEWMRLWAEDAAACGAVLAADPVICQEDPDDEALDACRRLGLALA